MCSGEKPDHCIQIRVNSFLEWGRIWSRKRQPETNRGTSLSSSRSLFVLKRARNKQIQLRQLAVTNYSNIKLVKETITSLYWWCLLLSISWAKGKENEGHDVPSNKMFQPRWDDSGLMQHVTSIAAATCLDQAFL